MGCGNGVHAARLRDSFDWIVQGIEPSREASAAARKHGLEVHNGTLDDYTGDGRFELVTLIHVLEHVPEPLSTVQRAFSLLAPGGQLVLAVPNADSLERRLSGRFWDAWDIPRHIHHFGPGSLRKLVTEAGLVVEHLDYECYTVAGRSLANRRLPEVAYHERKRRYRSKWIETGIGRLLAVLRTSSAMQLVARRPDGDGPEIVAPSHRDAASSR